MKRMISWKMFAVAVVAVLGLCLASPAAFAAKKKPNILVIWGDDVGYWNVSAYNQGMMGYETPKIDSIAKEGALFTDWYAQQSCTAGRAAFILGQHPFRTGLTVTRVGNSARTTWATRTNICRRSTASTSSSATSTISTQRKSPRATTIRKIPSSVSGSAPVACSTPGLTARAARKSRTPGP